jgi:CheY-like chemotaxis protein
MPGMDGLSVASTLREAYQEDAPPIVLMVTAFSRDELLRQPGIDKVDGVLSKPVTSSTLYNGVAAALERRGRGAGSSLREAVLSDGPRLSGLRILVVDDSDINREVALRILQAEGATVHLANDGSSGVSWLASHPQAVDIVLMDVQMPQMDGYTATRHLRALPSCAALPVVALTAGAFKAQQDAAQEAGMDAFVAKPFNVEELIATILRLCGSQPQAAAAPSLRQPQSAVPHDLAELPQLPGIDLAAGLAVWRELAEYRKFLTKFRNDYGDSSRRLHAHCAAGETAAARALAHKLKGTAGNLALPGVMAAAEALELALQPEAVASTSTALSTVDAALAQAIASIELLAPGSGGSAAPPAATAAIAADPEELFTLMTALRHTLDLDEPDGAAPLLDALNAMLGAAALQTLRNCVDNFDFRGAEAALQQLATSLSIPLEVTPCPAP